MEKLAKKINKINTLHLSLLSFLIFPGVLLMPYFMHSFLVIIPSLMCLVGGVCLGMAMSRTHHF